MAVRIIWRRVRRTTVSFSSSRRRGLRSLFVFCFFWWVLDIGFVDSMFGELLGVV